MTDITDHRKEIDSIDAEIAKLLEKRLDVVNAVAAYKDEHGMPVFDAAREQEKLQALDGLCSGDKQLYIADVFREIMAQSRKLQQELINCGSGGYAYGLLGRSLGHSYSPRIHRIIGDYEFGLIDLEPEHLDAFFKEGRFHGITVTMPYKRAVMKYCDDLSETAVKCGSVNTIVRRPDGTYYGDNTDYYGFLRTVVDSGTRVEGRKAIVLGSGGVSGTAVKVLEDLSAGQVIVISRTGTDNYENLDRHFDAQIVVNATPVGMYPNAGEAAVDIRSFTACEAVFDLVYNPLRTKLMLDAEQAGIPAFSGLYMLTAQAAKAYRLFCSEGVGPAQAPDPEWNTEDATRRACARLKWEKENIVLIGMPGCGKTTVGKKLSEISGKPFIDCDAKIAELYGRSPEEIITNEGVECFRDIESAVIRQVLRKGDPGVIFAAGGGCVEREDNRVPLLENSMVVYLQRDLSRLPTDGRPVSQTDGLCDIYERRREKYENWSDLTVACR